jgi:uncharacterized protein
MAVWLALAGLCTSIESAAADSRPPGADQVEALARGLATHAHDLLEELEARLSMQPGDVRAAIARCELLEAVAVFLEATWELPIPVEVDFSALDGDEAGCDELLVERFPTHPDVRLYELERSWGDEALAAAQRTLADATVVWTNEAKARFHEVLAWRYRWLDRLEEAAASAREATRLDESLDLTLLLAEGLALEGNETEAIAVLASRLTEPGKLHEIYRKAQKLVDLGACEVALPVFDLEGMESYTLLHAEVLECLGESEAARAKYETLTEGWNRGEILLRLFKLGLTSGDREVAHRSYVALRDLGWHADPLGRHRLSLSLAFPGAPWQLRDALGLLTLGALALGILLLPALAVLPVHYIGLLRRVHGSATPREHRWRLRHVWMASSGLLAAQVAAAYVFLEGEIELWFSDHSVSPQYSPEVIARFGLTFFALTAVVAAALLRKGDLRALTRVQWPAIQVLAVSGTLVVALVVLACVNALLASLLGLLDFSSLATGTVELTRLTLFRSILETYGLAVYFLFSVLLIPVYEEILFRWVLLDGFARHIPFGWANGLQAGIFATLHESLALFPLFFAFGLLLGAVRRRAGGILPGILAHAGYNGILFLIVALGTIL